MHQCEFSFIAGYNTGPLSPISWGQQTNFQSLDQISEKDVICGLFCILVTALQLKK